MITFRYHIVSLVSVFLALAIGIALGGGPLKGEVDNSLVKELAARKKIQTEQRHEIRRLRASGAFADGYAKATAPTVLAGRLRGVPVAVVSMPGANRATVSYLQDLVSTSGGKLVGRYRVGDKLGDNSNKGLVDQLGTQLEPEADDVEMPDDVSTYQRFGLLLGRAIGTRSKARQRYDTTSSSLVSGFGTAGLVSAVGTPTGRARVVLVVTGPGDEVPHPGRHRRDPRGRRRRAHRRGVQRGPRRASRRRPRRRTDPQDPRRRRALGAHCRRWTAPAPEQARWSASWPPRRTSRAAPASTAPSTRRTARCPATRPDDGEFGHQCRRVGERAPRRLVG